MENLKNLNDKFFMLYGRLYENKKFLSKKQFNVMSEELAAQYKIEAKKILAPKVIEDKYQLFIIKRRAVDRVPFKFLFFSNKIARLICKSIKKDLEEFYKTVDVTKPVGNVDVDSVTGK